MHVLIVLAHPDHHSYTAAGAGSLRQGIEDAGAGNSAELADLHREGFDPRFTAADRAHYLGGPLPADIAVEHARVDRADALAFVYPVYWWSYPALLKGWIDRVLTGGWAYSIAGDATTTGGLKDRPTLQIRMGGSRPATYAKYGYDRAITAQQDVGTYGFCGLTDVESHDFFDIEGDANAARREQLLRQARALGAALVSPQRASRPSPFGRVRAPE
jgi:NAD(P)H dehydrogenase (quinone)